MRKLISVSLLLSLLFLTAHALHAQTRPRRVGNTTATQQTDQQPAEPDEQQQPAQMPSTQKRPVLQTGTTISSGNRNPSSQKPQSSAPSANNDPEEVGEGDVVRVNTTLVTIPVSVMDRNGRFIPDLRKDEFQIFEDGVQQNVSYFASIEKPFTVALVIDTSASTHFRMDEMQDAAIEFVNQLRPDDRVLVVSFDSQIRVLAEATNDRNVLRDAIRNTRTGGNTRLYDAIDFVIHQRLNQISGRKAIVLFTDGVDTTSKHAKYEDNMRDAEELDALIYPVQYDTYNDVAGPGGGSWPSSGRYPSGGSGSIVIDILGGILGGGRRGGGGYGRGGGGGGGNGPGMSRDDYMRADAYLHDLAYKTGGRVFQAETTGDLSQSFANIAEELRRQYSLGYYPKAQAQTGTRRQIKVRVQRPDLVVRARDSYIVGASSGDATAQGNTQQQSKPVLQKHQLANVQ